MTEMLLFFAFAVGVTGVAMLWDQHRDARAARKRNQARPWR